ncbi:hypothetical protein NDR87_26410 [Nocardia sp. CDC159]|uniref:Uncharacterized protein n=1 Tax=Nocardia pulmonis TaxID=2951408 RepID=A0A9X2E7D4_9NOCA|nr:MULTISPECIES: hypothetical protein [Nocardia]MCM6774981.1 hypothetical protein [Nocardia pulmonis]MCM6789912.1 hypothetical protein [Nocardia sp. CDC159]
MADRAITLIGFVVESLRLAFSENSATPPLGGGSPHVRFFAGDSLPLAAWAGHSASCDCADPMLWVRVVRRFRTATLPNEEPGEISGCAIPRAITIEAGVMRCAVVAAEPPWDELEREALVQLDDSHRVDAALCRAMQCAERENAAQSTLLAAGEPFGPEGGVIAWTQWAHAQLAG